MPVVFNTINRPASQVPSDASVVIELVGENGRRVDGYVASTDVTIEGAHRPTVDSAFRWEATLVANSLISPAGTMYKVVERVDDGGPAKYITMPATGGPYHILDILEAGPPAALDPPALSVVRALVPDEDDVGYDVVLQIGQSNACGRALPLDTDRIAVPDARIWQYGNAGEYAGQISLAVDHLEHHDYLTSTHGMGHGVEWARWYASITPTSRMILLVPAAHGGTGFTSANPLDWTATTGDLAINAVNQANAAIEAAGANSRIVAILWHQGENDDALTQAQYAAELDALIAYLRANITGAADVPFIVGQMSDLRIALTGGPVNLAHIDTPRRVLRTGFAYSLEGDALASDPSHFNVPGQQYLGRTMFDAYRRALLNVAAVDPVATTDLTFEQAGTSVIVTWPQPFGRATDFLVEYKLDAASTWTTLVRAQSIDVTATITGLTLGATYDVRVSTINEEGTSAPTEDTFTLETVPVQVTGLAAGNPGSTYAPLTWNAVANADTYLIEYKATSSGVWLTFGTVATNSGTVTGLLFSTSYDFRVSATNEAGTGTASSTVSATTDAVGYMLADVSASAARAYSVARKLSAGYAGACIRVRRSSDNAEQDIGFVGTLLDTATLLTFAGGGSAFIKTIYDQSGNARDKTQTTTTAQPRIVNAGVLDTVNSQPAANFDGTDYFTSVDAGGYAAGAATGLIVIRVPVARENNHIVNESSTTSVFPVYALVDSPSTLAPGEGFNAFIRDDNNSTRLGQPQTTPAAYNNVLNQMTAVDTGTQVNEYVNGALNTRTTRTYTRTPLTVTNHSIGALVRTTVTVTLIGQLSEYVEYYSALSDADRTAGAANQKSFYATP